MKKSSHKMTLVTKPAYEVGRNTVVTGRRLPSMTYMSNEFVPGCDVYVEFCRRTVRLGSALFLAGV